jgi:hypothetical protein
MRPAAQVVAFAALVASACLVSTTYGFVHGEPEPSDDPDRSRSAQEMLTRLWSAARERADVVRTNRQQAQGRGETYSLSNADMFGSMLDYMKDKITTPPLLSTEKNLLLLHESVVAIATELAATRALLDALLEHDIDSKESKDSKYETKRHDAMSAVMRGRLVPVQGPRYTIIGKD